MKRCLALLGVVICSGTQLTRSEMNMYLLETVPVASRQNLSHFIRINPKNRAIAAVARSLLLDKRLPAPAARFLTNKERAPTSREAGNHSVGMIFLDG